MKQKKIICIALTACLTVMSASSSFAKLLPVKEGEKLTLPHDDITSGPALDLISVENTSGGLLYVDTETGCMIDGDLVGIYKTENGDIYYDTIEGSIIGSDKNFKSADIPALIDGTRIVGIGDKSSDKVAVFNVEGGRIYYNTSDGTIMGSDKGITKAVIPSVMPDGTKIKTIGVNAFDGCSYLENVTIPTGVEKIDYGAFNGCIKLKSITIPESVKSIGKLAFVNCIELEKVNIPKSVTEIKENAFRKLDNIKIGCIKDSCAENFAKNNKIPYVNISEEDISKPEENNKIDTIIQLTEILDNLSQNIQNKNTAEDTINAINTEKE